MHSSRFQLRKYDLSAWVAQHLISSLLPQRLEFDPLVQELSARGLLDAFLTCSMTRRSSALTSEGQEHQYRMLCLCTCASGYEIVRREIHILRNVLLALNFICSFRKKHALCDVEQDPYICHDFFLWSNLGICFVDFRK